MRPIGVEHAGRWAAPLSTSNAACELRDGDRFEPGWEFDLMLPSGPGSSLSWRVDEKNRAIQQGRSSGRFFVEDLTPAIREFVNELEPAQEARIADLEARLLTHLEEHGVDSLPPFALRGISCSSLQDGQVPEEDLFKDFSLEAWRRRGYISRSGGNFFVFHPGAREFTPDDFLYLLHASAGSTSRYASREEHPVVIVVAMDDQLNIPAKGGNDGITGTYPWTAEVGSELCHFHNLDVGSVARKPGEPGIPVDKVIAEIGSEGLPESIEGVGIWDRTPQQEMALARFVYLGILEELVNLSQC